MQMLGRILIQLVGLVLSLGPLTLIFFRLLKNGWRNTFEVRQRHLPAVLQDSRHGLHGSIEGSGGVQLHYVEKGDRTKPLMLFLHGFPEFWFSWRFQMAHFSSKYWYVLVPYVVTFLHFDRHKIKVSNHVDIQGEA